MTKFLASGALKNTDSDHPLSLALCSRGLDKKPTEMHDKECSCYKIIFVIDFYGLFLALSIFVGLFW